MERAFRFLSSSIVVAAAAAWAPSALAQCVAGGGGGAIPTTGTGDGTWPTTMPTAPLVSSYSVTVPGGATVLNSVKLIGLSHTWVGDLQIVLETPGGVKTNVLHRPGHAGSGFGCAQDLGGDYEIFDPIAGSGGPCSGGVPSLPCVSSPIPSGSYVQEYSSWATGTNLIDNTGLESLVIASGTWTLYVYDWAGGDVGSLTSWELCFGSPTPPPPPPPPPPAMQCVGVGAGGFFPATGSANGTWPTTMPTGEAIAPLAVTPPAGATQIVALKIYGFDHTWFDDPQFVLEDPAGGLHNIFQANDGVFGGSCGDPWFGDYTFIDGCYAGNLAFGCSGSVAPGTYEQYFGAWPSGSSGIANTPLNSIPVMTGTYNLRCYDWYVAVDDGTFTSWELCFDVGGGSPTAYCDPLGATSDGCLPTTVAPTQPNVAHNSGCTISFQDLPGLRSGIVFYSVNGSQNSSWCGPMTGNSALCVVGPTWRTGIQDTMGTSGACDGELFLDWDAYQLGNPGAQGQPWSAGNQAWVQGWFRSSSDCRTTFLTGAVELTYQ